MVRIVVDACKVNGMTDAAEMQRLLSHANYRKVGDALGVSRATVSEWARGNDVSPFRVRQVRQLLGKDLGTRRIAPTHTGSEQPEWAGAMERRLRKEMRLNRALIEGRHPDEVERMRAEIHAETPDEPPRDGGGPMGEQHPLGRSSGTRR